MLLCLGEPPVRFLWCCCSSFVVFLHFVVLLHSHFFSRRHPAPFRGILPGFYIHCILSAQPIAEWFATLSFSTNFNHFHFIFFLRALRPWVGIFYPQAFFTLRSFTDILTCVYQGFPGSRQFFLEVCRASYWSSKHRPGTSVCLIYSNPQPSYSEWFSFKFCHILA